MPPMASEALLTTPEVAVLLGKSERTVRRMAERGQLRAQKLSGPARGVYLFRLEDIKGKQ